MCVFICGCAGFPLLLGLFSIVASGGYFSSCCVQAAYCSGFSCWDAQALGLTGFGGCGSRALGHSLHSCGTQTQLLSSMWDLPASGIEPTSPALAGRLSPTAPPGRPQTLLYLKWIIAKALLYSPWSAVSAVWKSGWEGSLGENGCTCVYSWGLSCSPETIIAFLISYPPV